MSHVHDLFWANFFGISAAEFAARGTSVVAHAGLAGFRGVWFFRRGDRLVVSAPAAWLPRVRGGVAAIADVQGFPDEAVLRELFDRDLEQCIGPAFQGCLEPDRFRAAPCEHVRSLTEADSLAVASFREACAIEDWRDSGLEKAGLHRAAYFEDDAITAMAGFRPWSATAGDPCVLTHPACRGSGRGKRVVSHVVRMALDQGSVLLYQTLESNLAAVGLALGLGYERYANHLAVRLASDRPSG
jgi:GNAT superfamily N-acetyltransferase